ncbi:PEP-CTERM sorting domain-containing protein [Microcystis aeruginosa]|jgi:hypothetical protein|uniref:PEP-CTERM protein-sorting domain-containing protein n=1 Tax=Microcystis aeruginosa (strain NIES-843 / IAM M-2473) TaxID=449447 RepID=B0JJF0_MICAN|nr:PEP-CTERM sorting domain-containing protein [Microcystis aeruginosa]BAG02592.1 hypothetical protein MAE_27700 [Microcystis aeruginosa NIES-843]
MSMRHFALLLGLGLTMISTVMLPSPSVQAEPVIYIETGGKESLSFDPDGLAVLESIGLSLASVENTDTPAQGYDYAFNILPPSSDPNIRGTDWVFSYDQETGNYEVISGTTEFTGSIFFNVDQNKLSLPSVLEIGNFSASFQTNTNPDIPLPFLVFITDTLNTGLKVLSPIEPGLPNVDLNNNTWSLEPVPFLFTKEFSDFLVKAGATQSVEGLQIAIGRADRSFVPLSTQSVPEPSSILGLLMVVLAAGYSKFLCIK